MTPRGVSLEPGANFVTTRQTPEKHGTEMVHGAEVQYPGFQVLIRYGGGEAAHP